MVDTPDFTRLRRPAAGSAVSRIVAAVGAALSVAAAPAPTQTPNKAPGRLTVDAKPSPQPFDESRMTPPLFLFGPTPQYDEQATEHGIEGLISVRCIVTRDGRVHGCRVLRGLPFLDNAVIRALEQRQYSPATIEGLPVDVEYVFNVRMRLPR